MPPPRNILAGQTYVLSRRTERRVHLFRPDAAMNQVFLYCLAVAAQETRVLLHAVVLMSNHYHIEVTDPDRRICEFAERLNGLLTKTTQALRGWQGRVFDAEGPIYTEVLSVAALVKQAAYTVVNPTAAGLVRFSKDWPGVRTRVAEIGGAAITVERPKVYFAADGTMPERVELRFVMPEALIEAHGLEGAREQIAEAASAREKEVRAEVEAEGWSFKGADRVLKSSPYSRAKTFEKRHELKPRYACGGDKEALSAAIERDAEFVVQYARARERWLAGERHVVWPAGTYAMRRLHKVRCAEPPS